MVGCGISRRLGLGTDFFYGVPDSGVAPYHNLFNCSFHGPRWLTGGTVGPEASIFTPVMLVRVAIIFTLFLSRESVPSRRERVLAAVFALELKDQTHRRQDWKTLKRLDQDLSGTRIHS